MNIWREIEGMEFVAYRVASAIRGSQVERIGGKLSLSLGLGR
jgi:hypothetical protein